MTLNDLISEVKKRPGAFLGDDINLKALSHFITVFLYSKSVSDQTNDTEKCFRKTFRNFVEDEVRSMFGLDINLELPKRWDEIITLSAGSDDIKSLDLFYKIYDDFLTSLTESS